MEDVNKSFDVDKMFSDVKNDFEKYESEQKDGEVLMSMALRVLIGLTNILKKIEQKNPDSMIVNRVNEFVDKIHNSRGNGSLWSLSTCEKGGEA